MLFSSIPFLFYFLPPDRWKNLTLLLSSLVFYGWGEPRFLLFMLASIAQGYAFGRLMAQYPRRKRLFLALSAVLSLGLLGYCKYAGFFLRTLGALTGLSLPALQIALPIGISFYTFQVARCRPSETCCSWPPMWPCSPSSSPGPSSAMQTLPRS